MPRILPAVPCTLEQHEMLMSLAWGQKVQARLKVRARIVLRGIDGVGIKDTAKEMGLDKDTVSLWRCRFLTAGATRRIWPLGRCLAGEHLGRGRVAGLGDFAHRMHLSGAQTFLVCQPGPGLCRQGGRRGGAVPGSTGTRHSA